MTYAVNVKGILEIIKTPPEKLLQNWEDFKISKKSARTVQVKLSNRTPYYPDMVTKLFVLSQYYKGKLVGKGEDGNLYTIELPVSKEDIIRASERKEWDPNFMIYQKFFTVDRFYTELEKIGFLELYPEWLKTIKKEYLRSF